MTNNDELLFIVQQMTFTVLFVNIQAFLS